MSDFELWEKLYRSQKSKGHNYVIIDCDDEEQIISFFIQKGLTFEWRPAPEYGERSVYVAWSDDG